MENSDEDVVVAASKLAPGDSMYPERKASKVLPANLKRSLPITPPYKTRASGTVGEQATPYVHISKICVYLDLTSLSNRSKKPRKDAGPDNAVGESDVDNRAAKKRGLSSTKAKARVGDDGDEYVLFISPF